MDDKVPGVEVIRPAEIKERDHPTILPTAPERWRGPVKLRRMRDYSGGSIRDLIRQAQTAEELEEVRQFVVELAGKKEISAGTLAKLDAAGAAKQQELASRLVVGVGGGGIVVPKLIIPGR